MIEKPDAGRNNEYRDQCHDCGGYPGGGVLYGKQGKRNSQERPKK
jgi:hypothetical protein